MKNRCILALILTLMVFSSACNQTTTRSLKVLPNDAMSPLFLATIEATEEAVYNSLFRATTVTGRDKRPVAALSLEQTLTILRRYGKIK